MANARIYTKNEIEKAWSRNDWKIWEVKSQLWKIATRPTRKAPVGRNQAKNKRDQT